MSLAVSLPSAMDTRNAVGVMTWGPKTDTSKPLGAEEEGRKEGGGHHGKTRRARSMVDAASHRRERKKLTLKIEGTEQGPKLPHRQRQVSDLLRLRRPQDVQAKRPSMAPVVPPMPLSTSPPTQEPEPFRRQGHRQPFVQQLAQGHATVAVGTDLVTELPRREKLRPALRNLALRPLHLRMSLQTHQIGSDPILFHFRALHLIFATDSGDF